MVAERLATEFYFLYCKYHHLLQLNVHAIIRCVRQSVNMNQLIQGVQLGGLPSATVSALVRYTLQSCTRERIRGTAARRGEGGRQGQMKAGAGIWGTFLSYEITAWMGIPLMGYG